MPHAGGRCSAAVVAADGTSGELLVRRGVFGRLRRFRVDFTAAIIVSVVNGRGPGAHRDRARVEDMFERVRH